LAQQQFTWIVEEFVYALNNSTLTSFKHLVSPQIFSNLSQAMR